MKKVNLGSKAIAAALIMFGAATILPSCKKEEGCTDPTAVNFDADAEEDDGSCEFTLPEEDNVIVVSDNGAGTGTTTWTKDKCYVLDGLVFVNSGQTLTIEPGTVIKGRPGAGANASALVVANGGTLMAVGTAAEPIIFTAEADELNGNIPVTTRGLWGGLIVLGDASLNSTPGQTAIEGIPTSESRGIYGGSNDNHNAGTIRYVSVRHGGTDIGSGNEINGVTFGGVGSGTTVEYLEVIANNDDGVEFFGGTVNTKYVMVSFCKDDSYDYDEGYRGKGQFWATIQDPIESDRGGEHDGGTTPETAMPFATPVIYNVTSMGSQLSGANSNRTITFP